MKNVKGFEAIAERIENARDRFVVAVCEQFGKTREEAMTVFSVFKSAKAIKIDAVTGQFTLTHGAFWDLNVINNALAK